MIEYRAIRDVLIQGLRQHLETLWAVATYTETLKATNTPFLHLSKRPIREVHSVTVGGEALASGEFTYDANRLVRADGVWDAETVVEYEAGVDSIPIILASQAAPKPGYPFLTYLPTTPLSGQSMHTGVYQLNENGDLLDWTRDAHSEMVISLTIYSKDSDMSHELALQAAAWVGWKGYLALKDSGVIVKRREALVNRDTMIVDDYERRVGFDVVLGVGSVVKAEAEEIETVEYERSEQ